MTYRILDDCEPAPPKSDNYGWVLSYVNGKQVNGYMPASLHGVVAREVIAAGGAR